MIFKDLEFIRCFRKLSITFFLCIIFFLILVSCASNQHKIKVNFEEIQIKSIDNLLAEGYFAEALVELRSLIINSSYNQLNSKIFNLTATALYGLGRNNDAMLASGLARLAKKDFYKSPQNLELFKSKIEELLNQISSTAPVGPTVVAKNNFKTDSNLVSITKPGMDLLINNVWFETDIRQVLTDLSQEAEIPIIWDNTVQGLVTYEARETPFSKVLNDILFSNGYFSMYRDGTYYVGSTGEESNSFPMISETRTLQLSNISAMEAIQLLPKSFRDYVSASNTSNIVCISAAPSLVNRIVKDLKVIDAPLPLIEIEAVVVEFATTKIRQLGLDWDLKSLDWSEREASLSITTPEMGDAVLALDFFRNMLKIDNDTRIDLVASLKALSEAGVAKIRATPRIRTLNGHTAIVATTKEQYFFITAGETGQYYGYYSRLETIKSGIQLEITPYVDSLQYITVDVKPQVDDVVGQGASGLPEISRRAAKTTVRVKNGETFTIGGLRVSEKKSVNHRVPFLGSIPVLGALFGKTENEEVEKELVIFITPNVL